MRSSGSIFVCFYTPHLLSHPASPLLSLPLTLPRLTYWWASSNLGEAVGVNGVRVSAGRLGDAEKSSVKVTALYCCITGRLAALGWLHTTQV